jgi:hypothetical protein
MRKRNCGALNEAVKWAVMHKINDKTPKDDGLLKIGEMNNLA